MSLVVIDPPAQAVAAADARTAGIFTSADGDDLINALLMAAQGSIDGPDGWLGRAIGLQTLEMQTGPWGLGFYGDGCAAQVYGASLALDLPYLPIRSIVGVYAGASGAAVDPTTYALVNNRIMFTAALPSGYPARIRYTAGYGQLPNGGTNLPVPAPIKHAILLMAAQLKSVTDVGGQLIRDEVTGVSVRHFATPTKTTEDAITKTAEALLGTFRVFA